VHARPLSIPFFGLVNFATSVAHPAGVKHLDLAMFEDLDLDEHAVRNIGEAVRRSAKGQLETICRGPNSHRDGIVYIHEDSTDCKTAGHSRPRLER